MTQQLHRKLLMYGTGHVDTLGGEFKEPKWAERLVLVKKHSYVSTVCSSVLTCGGKRDLIRKPGGGHYEGQLGILKQGGVQGRHTTPNYPCVGHPVGVWVVRP